MAVNLKPESELLIAATAVAIVISVFNSNTPNLADVRHDQPGNMNTHKATKLAAITSVAYIGSLALLSRSPTVFIYGGGAILFETWKLHFANHGASGAQENVVSDSMQTYAG
jgi:hypothetical protein